MSQQYAAFDVVPQPCLDSGVPVSGWCLMSEFCLNFLWRAYHEAVSFLWQDVLVVCSSAGWTDQKHMLYLSLLQESFVNQLHDGEISFKGLFNLSPRVCRPKQSSKGSAKNTEAGQGYLGVVEVDRAKSWIKVEQIRSPCCEDMEDGEVHCMGDDEASTTEPVQESSSQASATSSGQSSTSHFGKRRHSPCRTAGRLYL